jgi:hypothetical protein
MSLVWRERPVGRLRFDPPNCASTSISLGQTSENDGNGIAPKIEFPECDQC